MPGVKDRMGRGQTTVSPAPYPVKPRTYLRPNQQVLCWLRVRSSQNSWTHPRDRIATPMPVLSNAFKTAHLEYSKLALPEMLLVVSDSATVSWAITMPQKCAGVPPPPAVLSEPLMITTPKNWNPPWTFRLPST